MAKVICGVYEMIINDALADKTISELQDGLKVFLNIPDNPTILLNDNPDPDSGEIVQNDDTLEFIKPAGISR